MSQLFISYARKDIGFVEDLVCDLEKRGMSCWVDRHDIIGGTEWRAEIGKAIMDCDAFLIVLSPDSVASENVKREVAFAESHGCQIIPIRYKPCSLPPEMGLALSNLQWCDFSEPTYEDAFARLVQAMRSRSTPEVDGKPGSRPQLVYWISGLYLAASAYELLAFALFLFGIDASGEITDFVHNHPPPELVLAITIAAVNIPATILLLRMKAQAVQLFFLKWALNTGGVGIAIGHTADRQERLGAIVSCALATYALYYTYRLKQDARLDHQTPPAEAHQTTNARASRQSPDPRVNQE
jgi:TIR domain